MGLLLDYLSYQTVLAVLIVAVILYVTLRSRSSPLRSLPLPPGPPVTRWLSGHFSIIPESQTAKVYAEWAEKYGSVIHLRAYHQHIILLSSIDDCIELFEKRSNLYSDRPVLTMIELMGWDLTTAMIPYGPRWRRHRRLFQQAFRRVPSLSHCPEQIRKVNDMLYDLLTNPDGFIDHVKTMTAATSMSITYGYDINRTKDYFVELSEDAVLGLSSAVHPGSALVNAVPVLQYLPAWFPGADFHKVAAKIKVMTTKMKEVPFKWVQKNIETGTQPNCLVSEYLPSCKNEDDIVTLQEFAATVYAGERPVPAMERVGKTDDLHSLAGADTTTSALTTFFYAMSISPDAQRKAQEELDTVVGSGRLPNYNDWDSLPYTEALLREVLRWRPVLPLGLGHALTEDDVFKGYLIPKGSVVMPNIWAISREESRYVDPEVFNPDRFFDQEGILNDDESNYIFGFGRRMCPGRHMARATMWMSMATVLWAFNIGKAKDVSGNEISTNVEYTEGLISHPQSFACSITPRSPRTGKIIEEAVAQTRARSQ